MSKQPYITEEDLKAINDLAKAKAEATGDEKIWKAISYIALTGARLNEAIKFVADKDTDIPKLKKGIQTALSLEKKTPHDLRYSFALYAQRINAHPGVVGTLLGHKVLEEIEDATNESQKSTEETQ